MIEAIIQLFMFGDFEGWMVPYLGEESSALVDFILKLSYWYFTSGV